MLKQPSDEIHSLKITLHTLYWQQTVQVGGAKWGKEEKQELHLENIIFKVRCDGVLY